MVGLAQKRSQINRKTKGLIYKSLKGQKNIYLELHRVKYERAGKNAPPPVHRGLRNDISLPVILVLSNSSALDIMPQYLENIFAQK